MLPGLSRQHRPEPVNVLGQAVVRIGNEFGRFHLVADEMLIDEGPQSEARRSVMGTIELQDLLRMLTGCAVDEGLAVRKYPLHLHRDEEFLITVGRGQGVSGGNDMGVVAEYARLIKPAHCSL